MICFFFLRVQDIGGKPVDLGVYRGKVLLVVNVASKWYILFFSLVVVVILIFGILPFMRILVVFFFRLMYFFFNSGFTHSNYTQLSQLYERYKDQGLIFIVV